MRIRDPANLLRRIPTHHRNNTGPLPIKYPERIRCIISRHLANKTERRINLLRDSLVAGHNHAADQLAGLDQRLGADLVFGREKHTTHSELQQTPLTGVELFIL